MVSFGGPQTAVSLSAVTSLLCVSGHGLTWSCDVLTGFHCVPVGPSLALAGTGRPYVPWAKKQHAH